MTCDEKINSAQAALLEGDFQKSEQLHREVLQQEPQNISAIDGLGILLCQKGETEEGILYFKEALRLLQREWQPNPSWKAAVLFHLGLACRTLGLRQEALKFLTEAAALTPHEYELCLNLGQVQFELEQYELAATQFQTLTTLQPDNASTWLTLGYVLANLDNYDEAAEALKTAVSLDPSSPEACFFLAEALRKAEQYEESLPHYQRMLQVGTDYPQAVHGYGKALLALGNLASGWEAMEFRFASSVGNWERHHLPNWSPEADNNADNNKADRSISRVLAYSEESVGAELMFASCLPDLINSVEHCIVECEPSLHTLFRRSFPRADFVALAEDDVRPDSNSWGVPLDAQIAFGSLPRHFRRNIDDFPLRKAYLVPNREMVSQWQNRLAGLGDSKKIGILWNGSWTHETPKQTSLPLQELRSLLAKHQEAAWICLQHGSHQNDMQQQRGNFGVSPRIFPEAFQYDIDSMAALLTALDLVITPPGYIAHLAGALGVRTWLLVPEGADWRHSIDIAGNNAGQVRSVWHPTIKMYRQAKGQSWQHFLEGINDDLEKFLVTYRPPEEMPITLKFSQRTLATILKAA